MLNGLGMLINQEADTPTPLAEMRTVTLAQVQAILFPKYNAAFY